MGLPRVAKSWIRLRGFAAANRFPVAAYTTATGTAQEVNKSRSRLKRDRLFVVYSSRPTFVVICVGNLCGFGSRFLPLYCLQLCLRTWMLGSYN
jgi:hypothetical protein